MNRHLPRCLNVLLLTTWGLHGPATQAMQAPAPASMPAPISSGSTYYLSPAAIHQLEQQAQPGNDHGQAAWRLYQYHAFASLDQNAALQWLAIATWQGHAIAQYNWLKTLIDQGQIKKAKAWASEARQQQRPLDAKALKLLDGL